MSVENGLGREARAVGTKYEIKNAENIPYLRHGRSPETKFSTDIAYLKARVLIVCFFATDMLCLAAQVLGD